MQILKFVEQAQHTLTRTQPQEYTRARSRPYEYIQHRTKRNETKNWKKTSTKHKMYRINMRKRSQYGPDDAMVFAIIRIIIWDGASCFFRVKRQNREEKKKVHSNLVKADTRKTQARRTMARKWREKDIETNGWPNVSVQQRKNVREKSRAKLVTRARKRHNSSSSSSDSDSSAQQQQQPRATAATTAKINYSVAN